MSISGKLLCWLTFNGDWVEIYQYVFTRTMGGKTPDELRVGILDGYRMNELLKLKRWLWNKRMEERLERRRQKKREDKTEAEAPVQLVLLKG